MKWMDKILQKVIPSRTGFAIVADREFGILVRHMITVDSIQG